MPADATRLPEGVVLNGSLAIARPINTVIENAGVLYISTNAGVATYTALGTSGTFPQGAALTFNTGTGTLSLTGGAADVLITDTGGVALVIGDQVPLSFGTGVDVTFNPNGTNLVLEQGAGAGLLLAKDDTFVIVDPVDTTKRARIDAGLVTAGQTRVLTLPNYDYTPGVSTNPDTTADPGTGVAIPVTLSTSIELTIGAGAETNTMAAPAAVGQQISLIARSAGGGTRTITVSAAINQAGNTKMDFTQAADWALLRGVTLGGVLTWRVVQNDGVTLS